MHRRDLVAVLAGLSVPSPERARIAEELAADLEDMRAELVRRGMHPADAEEEALRLLAPSDVAVAALASVHEPLYASIARRFSYDVRTAEWVALVGVTLVAIGLVFGSLIAGGVLRNPSPLLLPLVAVSAFVLAIAGRKAIQLHLMRDHAPRRLHAGMGSLLVGSCVAVLIGFGGAAYELQRLAARLELEPERTGELMPSWLMDTSVLIGAGLATALVGGLAWFLLRQKISAVEGAELRAAQALSRSTSTAAV